MNKPVCLFRTWLEMDLGHWMVVLCYCSLWSLSRRCKKALYQSHWTHSIHQLPSRQLHLVPKNGYLRQRRWVCASVSDYCSRQWIYPDESAPVDSQRLCSLQDGLDDFELVRMIKDKAVVEKFIEPIIRSSTDYTSDPKLVEKTRREIAQYLQSL